MHTKVQNHKQNAIRSKALNIISYRVAKIVRPDPSYTDLLSFRDQGYEQAVFVANLIADPQCAVLNGNIYMIADLLRYDNPLYRTSHPNCNCKFAAYGNSSQQPTTAVNNEEPQQGQGSNQTNQAGTI